MTVCWRSVQMKIVTAFQLSQLVFIICCIIYFYEDYLLLSLLQFLCYCVAKAASAAPAKPVAAPAENKPALPAKPEISPSGASGNLRAARLCPVALNLFIVFDFVSLATFIYILGQMLQQISFFKSKIINEIMH